MIGDLIHHYRVLELLGRGAMGVVYKALDVNLERPVAIKVMSAEARGDPEFVERFRQEARVQGALNHPNVALLFDYFVHDGAPVAVMEFIDGESLEQLIRRRGPIPAHESIPIFKQALRGVSAAHRAGIIHRDLKPSNLMVTKDGVVKVMDFGIAKRQGVTGATNVSTSIGSPLYMAPEQILGRVVDFRTDVYSLGTTLYELLSGQPPFNPRGKAEYLVLDAHVNEPPESPLVHCRDIPQALVDAVMRALAKEPDARFQSADEFMRALPDVSDPITATRSMGPKGTVALDYSPEMSGTSVTPSKQSGTMAFEYTSSTRRDRNDSMAFDYSALTLRQVQQRPPSAPLAAATALPAVATHVAAAATPAAVRLSDNGTRPSPVQLRRPFRPAIVGVLVATLLLGALVRHAERVHARRRHDSPTLSGLAVAPLAAASSETEAAAVSSADRAAATVAPQVATTLAGTAAPARRDLSGTWGGEYVDVSGQQLLRVVSLSISRVRDDGGIEGTLHYEAPSGDGECTLRPRGSTYSASERRLQLSPEGCSAHYPKELGVPLDFDGVDPAADTLKDGRIEAPTGEIIRVGLKRFGA